MNSLKDLLDVAAPLTPPGADALDDLARGRALLRGRRIRRAATAGTGLAVAATLAAFVVPMGTAPPTPSPGTSVAAPATAAVRLVAYTGEQPPGYTLETIPEGWTVASSDAAGLELRNPDAPPTEYGLDAISVIGDLNGTDLSEYPGKDVLVNGRPGVLQDGGDKLHASLVWTQEDAGAGTPPLRVVVQLPTSVDWDEATILRFAEGVTVSPDATGAVG